MAFLGAVVLISIILAFQHFQTKMKIEDFAREAHEAFAAGKYDQAKTWWDKVLTLAPEDPVALDEWRRADEKAEDPVRMLREQRDLQRRIIKANHHEAEQFIRAGKYQRALGLTLQILAFDPNDPEALKRKQFCEEALAQEELKIEKSIEEKDQKLIEQREKENELKRQRLSRINAFPEYHRASQLVEEAARMRLQDEAGTGFTIADVHEKYQEAKKALTLAIEKDKTYAEALYFRGRVRHRLGEFDFADLDFKEAWDYSSDSIPVALAAAKSQLAIYVLHHHAPADVRDGRGRDAALARLEAWAVKAEKSNKSQSAFEHWSAKALLEFRSGRTSAAQQSLSYVKHEGRANYFYHFMNACLHAETGDWRAAHQELTSALELEPVALEARYLRAIVRIRTEDLTNAMSDARKAVEIAPSRSPITWLVYVLRAQIHHELREVEAATADLDKAAGLAGSMAGIVNTLKNRWLRAPRPEK
jgi:tetratricopeptide (TPR) repeat protein